MYQDGTVGHNIRYQDICSDKYAVSIAYYYSNGVVNNSMVEWESINHKSGHGDFVGIYSSISYDYEIMAPFLENYDIIVNWIDCNYTVGTFDYETGTYTTGVFGQVKIFNRYKFQF